MIHIPDPCHEDFNKMTPTERGSFCSKCSTDTYDFRRMAIPEIKFILENSDGKVCGQIYQHQINKINADYLNWDNTKTFQSKFLVALLFGFGLSLFSCAGNESAIIASLQKTKPSFELVSHNTVNKCADPDDFNLVDFVVPKMTAPEDLMADEIWEYGNYTSKYNPDSIHYLPTIEICEDRPESRLAGEIVSTAGYLIPYELNESKSTRNDWLKNLFKRQNKEKNRN